MILTDNEILSTLITNNKDRFIKKLQPVVGMSEEQTQELIDFFHKHANLENQIPWNDVDKDPQGVYDKIVKLAQETTEKANQRVAKKTDIKSLFSGENFRVINEDENFVYVAPLDYQGAVYMDSFDCGGAGAKWCIGWEQDARYWRQYIGAGDAFCLIMTKPSSEISLYDLFRGMDGKANLENMDESDNKAMCQIHKSGNVTIWSQVKDSKIIDNVSIPELNSFGFTFNLDVPTDAHEVIRNAMNDLRESRGESALGDIESEKGRALVQFLTEEFGEATDVEMDNHESYWFGNGEQWKVLTDEEADEAWRDWLDELARDSECVGDDVFNYVDEEWFEDAYEEDCEYRWNESFDDDEKRDWILENTDVEETEEYFELNEDGDVDLDMPKFDYDDYCDQYVDENKNLYDGYNYASEWYRETFGDDSFREVIENNNLFDKDEWISAQMRYGDRGADIGCYDGCEHWVRTDDGDFYIYREC